jgi:hypothetical protein
MHLARVGTSFSTNWRLFLSRLPEVTEEARQASWSFVEQSLCYV